jgi:PIN domain nuclease of toxin-antitoxin system
MKHDSIPEGKIFCVLVDSCVLIDSFDPASANHASSLHLMEALADKEVVVIMPAHGYFEVQCAIERLKVEKRFNVPAIDPKKKYRLNLLPIDDGFIAKYKMADVPRLKAGDHIFLAVAKVDNISLITSDTQLLSAGRRASVSVFTPAEALAEVRGDAQQGAQADGPAPDGSAA